MISSRAKRFQPYFEAGPERAPRFHPFSNSRESPENLQADRLRIGLKVLPGIRPEHLRAIVPGCLMEVHMRKVVRMVALGTTALAVATIGGWSFSTTFATRAANIEANYENDPKRKLIGSYEVTGTDADGLSYNRAYIVDVSLAPSGALELNWDNGRQVGVGHVIDNVLAVATTSRGRTVLLIMTINPDGSLAGRWSRRTDRGYQGTETWTRLGS
jgi:hypothetical protein